MADFVNSLHRGLQILRAFTPAEPMLRLQDFVSVTGLSKSTALRLLRTLCALNYVQVDPHTKRYFLGPEIMSLGFAVLSNMDLREVALPYMDELARVSHQNVGLGILDGTEVVYIERIKKQRVITIDVYVGSRINAYRSSIGRAILAFLDERSLKGLLERLLKEKDAFRYVGRNGQALLDLLAKTRKRGYAVSDEELMPGVRSIAAPILRSGGEVEGAINMPCPTQMVSLQELNKEYAAMLVQTARKISAARGFVTKTNSLFAAGGLKWPLRKGDRRGVHQLEGQRKTEVG